MVESSGKQFEIRIERVAADLVTLGVVSQDKAKAQARELLMRYNNCQGTVVSILKDLTCGF
jgi:hypothetical protein